MIDSVASSIDWRRTVLGLSQVEVARMAGTTQSSVSRLERGTLDARISTLTETARALGMDLRLIPREILPKVDEMLQTMQQATEKNGESGEEPLYTLDEYEEDPG
ncbi:MAG: helix-turn-helix transcriptional regulator [Gemmatimonadota bacterium]